MFSFECPVSSGKLLRFLERALWDRRKKSLSVAESADEALGKVGQHLMSASWLPWCACTFASRGRAAGPGLDRQTEPRSVPQALCVYRPLGHPDQMRLSPTALQPGRDPVFATSSQVAPVLLTTDALNSKALGQYFCSFVWARATPRTSDSVGLSGPESVRLPRVGADAAAQRPPLSSHCRLCHPFMARRLLISAPVEEEPGGHQAQKRKHRNKSQCELTVCIICIVKSYPTYFIISMFRICKR